MNQQQKIPERWNSKKLKDVVVFNNGKGHERNIVDNGKYVVVNSKYISSNQKVVKYSDLQLSPLFVNDVVMVMSDVPNGKAIAKCFLVDKDNTYTLNQRIGSFNSKEITSQFLFYILNRNRYFLSFDDGVNQTNLRKEDILDCHITFPNIPEQNRVVEVLETWDKYLEKLDQKIKIKKNIKKGLMQNLLTGKIRLKNFSDNWQKKRLGNISSMRSGGTPKSTTSQFYDGNIPWVSITDMTSNGKYIYKTNKNLTEEGLKNCSAVIFPKGTILYAMYASIGECSIAGIDISSSQAILGIQPKKEILHSLFLYYWLTSLKEKIKLQGQQGTQSNLNAGIVKNFELFLPSFAEQSAIADILMVVDKEIETLEKQREIIKNQKKYLLNNLITGQIRLPEFI